MTTKPLPTSPGPRRGPGGAPLWLWWTVAAIVVVALGVFAWQLASGDEHPDDEQAASAEPTDAVSPTADATDTATTPPAEPTPTTPAMPLKAPGESRFVDGVSAIPTTPELPDADYFAHLTGVDVAARTVTFDVEVMYTGQAAIDYLTANDPTAENPPPNDFVIVNQSTATRTLPLADDARIWDWCTGGDGLDMVERPLNEWAAAPADGDTTCGLGAALSHGSNELYWFDVRGGVVQQVVGQYIP